MAKQQPAVVHQVHAPNRMTGIDVVAACPRRTLAFRFAFVPGNSFHEGVLFVWVPFPHKPAHLVIGDANPPEQLFDSRGRILDAESYIDPMDNLLGIAKQALGNFVFENLNLARGKFPRITLVVEQAEGSQPFVAVGAEPRPQLPETDVQQFGHILPRASVSHPYHSRESGEDSFVVRLLSLLLDPLPLLFAQDYWFHRMLSPHAGFLDPVLSLPAPFSYCRKFSTGDSITYTWEAR